MAASLKDLTIVIPAFRCAKYLPATVASALRCADAPILIAVNLGDDETVQTARELTGKFPDRIKLMENQDNLGMVGNWQRAFETVTTPFVLNLSADDLIRANYLTAATEVLRHNADVAIVGGGLLDVGEDFALDGSVPPEEQVAEAEFQMMSGTEIARFALIWMPYPAASSTIYRMDAWREIGGFDQKLNWCCDREIWFRIGRRHRAAYLPKVALYYRILETSQTYAYRKSDRFCFELGHMFTNARREWREPELAPMFRRKFLINTKTFLASSLRAVRRGHAIDSVTRIGCAFREAARVLS